MEHKANAIRALAQYTRASSAAGGGHLSSEENAELFAKFRQTVRAVFHLDNLSDSSIRLHWSRARKGARLYTNTFAAPYPWTRYFLQWTNDDRQNLPCCKAWTQRARFSQIEILEQQLETERAQRQCLQDEVMALRSQVRALQRGTESRSQAQSRKFVDDYLAIFRRARENSEFTQGFKAICVKLIAKTGMSIRTAQKVIERSSELCTGRKLPSWCTPARSTLRQWLEESYKQEIENTAESLESKVLHLSTDDSRISHENMHIILASTYNPATDCIEARQVDCLPMDSTTGSSLACADFDVLVKVLKLDPRLVVTYTSDHAANMTGHERGAITLLSRLIGHDIIPVGCGLHANALELKSSVQAFCSSLVDKKHIDRYLNLLTRIQLLLQSRSVAYKHLADSMDWALMMPPAVSLTRWPTLCNATEWLVINRSNVLDLGKLVLQGDPTTREVADWGEITERLDSEKMLITMAFIWELSRKYVLVQYSWLLSPSNNGLVLFRSAECGRRALLCLLTFRKLCAESGENQFGRYEKLAELLSSPSDATLREKVVESVEKAHIALRNMIEKHFAHTWLSGTALVAMLADPATAPTAIRAFCVALSANPEHEFHALQRGHASPSQLDAISPGNDDAAYFDTGMQVASERLVLGPHALLADSTALTDDVVFPALVEKFRGSMTKILTSKNPILNIFRDQAMCHCFNRLRLGDVGCFEQVNSCELAKWAQKFVEPTPHTNMQVESMFSLLRQTLHPNMSRATKRVTAMHTYTFRRSRPSRGSQSTPTHGHVIP